MTTPLLELRDVAKHFAGVRALDGVSLSIMPGEIHCLAGENGCGKSTLIKVVSGVHAIDRGTVLFDGVDPGPLSPRAAIAHGVQVIYQDFSLFGNLTVAENLSIGSELRERRRVVSWRRMREHAEAAVRRLGVHLDLDATVDSLPTSGRQLVAIARALMADPRLLIMDEPTTALTGREVATLFGVVRDIQARGIAVLFVSHKMREMLDISERLTVMRSGKVVAAGPIADFDEAAITRAMTGLEIPDDPYDWEPASGTTAPLLEVDRLGVPGELDEVSFSIRAGEIVGVSGLLGSGRTELALALFGMRPRHTGTVRMNGEPVRLRSVRDAIARRIAYVPEDRLTEGLFLPETIDRNIVATSLDALSRFGVMRDAAAAQAAADTIRDMAIATPTGDRPVMQLSGGNQQRVVIGRWLLQDPRLLILNGPTVGVDVGSKAGIHRAIRRLARERGLGVLMISDDLPELVGNCNRVLVMHRGRLHAELPGVRTADGAEALRRTERELGDRLKALA
ncbi:sugar ABC transporter ATP-binding protein [Rhizosaccharibacter radicis]|uniref:Sugar ABC transporter ATP-binding protein n=1 Tax=Rhizosaccharibacter radicis TaxID=2782605 RepID=A0ABT1W105_9PROT|nr:sugar ABC transporter ATP-binding protein [Acetobacteraceae bacterium KSS12]